MAQQNLPSGPVNGVSAFPRLRALIARRRVSGDSPPFPVTDEMRAKALAHFLQKIQFGQLTPADLPRARWLANLFRRTGEPEAAAMIDRAAA
jgi:hypothetical protein